MNDEGRTQQLPRPDGNVLAYGKTQGRAPTVVFLGGFRSDMTGTKAMALEAWAQRTGQAYLRFDYLGHGQSSGRFEDGTIGRWLDDSLAVIDQLADGKLVLVGSSMGGWLSLLAARARPERMTGVVLIAAAPDFTERMLLEKLSAEDRVALERNGRLEKPSQYSTEPSVFTWKLIEEGRKHLLLDKPLALPCRVRLLHGQSDPDVPWEHSLQIARHVDAPEVITTFIKGGDHRLSTPADIARLIATVEELVR
jgi:pimeloyl-ACP methyl ester carboxylesterase